MKTRIWLLGMLTLASCAGRAPAAEWFVATNGSDAAAGTNWATAKLTIQAGIDAAAPGDAIWVSNGVYAGLATVNTGIRLESVNGAEATTIQGSSSRCVEMSNAAAVVSGFTLTGGTADWGGGAYIVSGALEDCIIRDNTADGRDTSTAQEAAYGGGVYGGTLRRCIVLRNLATAYGDEYYRPLAKGGGTYNANLYDCLVVSNEAHSRFGWIAGDVTAGGGVSGGSAWNCTIVGNLASLDYLTEPGTLTGGGAYATALRNSIVYYNICRYEDLGPILSDVSGGSATNSCAPDISTSNGNLNDEPLFVDSGTENYRLGSESPCRDAGNNAYVAGATDLDGNPRIANGTVDMGAYEVQPGGGGGAWYVATNGNDAAAGTNWATAKLTIQAGVDAASAGDVVWVSNGVYDVGGRALYGGMTNRVAIDKSISVQSVNGPAATILRGGVATRCAYVGTNAALSGFTLTNGSTWNVEFSEDERGRSGGGVWGEISGMLSNCVLSGNSAGSYGGGAYGGGLRNCALNGNTASWGGGAHGATLWTCEVSGNYTASGGSGGGVGTCTANFCILSGNTANLSGGGGAFESTLNNCIVVDNLALIGGGTYAGSANNCVISGNWAGSGFPDDGTGGGGSAGGTLVNCIVFGNGATTGSNHLGSTFGNSCTAPDPGGSNNVVADPQFVNAGAGNYRLAAGSPCRDAGDNGVVTWTEDLDGNPRIVYGTVDMGAYEYRNITSYEDWAAGITNGLTNAMDCAAGDGVPNLLRYATGSPEPMVPDGLATLQIGAGALPGVVFNRNSDAADLSWIVESADAMTNGAVWRGVATNVGGSWLGATNVAESGAGNPVECTVTDPVALDPSRFLRLRVGRP